MNPLLSNTTQNVAMGLVSTAIPVGLIFTTMRQMGLDPWPVAADANLALLVTSFIVPFVSRAIAFVRDPNKAL